MAPPPSPDHPPGRTVAEDQRKEGFSEGTVGAVQTFFLRSDIAPWTKDRLTALAPLDTVIHLSQDRARAKIYPLVNVLTSRSRLLEEKLVSSDHAAIVEQVRGARSEADSLTLERALKLQNYFTQPFFVAEPYTKRPGVTVDLAEALRTCREILKGQYDDLPTDAFFFSGDMAEIQMNIGRSLSWGPAKVEPPTP